MSTQTQAVLQAIGGRTDPWAVKLREELTARAPGCTSSPEEAAAMGYQECPHCHGYGSSLHEQADRCTRCNGSGWSKKD